MMQARLAAFLNRPLVIGSRTLPNRLVLAPMTGLGHIAFRQWLDELGGSGLMFSEMCSAPRIPQENRHLSSYFRWRDQEAAHLSVQIVGSDADRLAAAARRIEAEGLFGVDINLGCSVREICRYHQGAALLKDPRRVVDIVEVVRRQVNCPVTVKYRTGWQDDPSPAVELARRLEDAGVDALTFHPRTAPDVRTRPPKWEYIGLVKQAVRIPVFGNGNVFDAADCLKMIEQTGCDGVALGRIAIARPWVFAAWTQAKEPALDFLAGALRLLDLLNEHFDSVRALRRYRQYASYLSANFAFGNTLFNKIRHAPDTQAIQGVLADFFSHPVQQLVRPNLNFLR